ncbi:ABC transporter ATP-binding protein [Komagataeibacter oboediens]|uniref:ABC transporter ATP-binding protein n=1 Tax=Komagataeibacter oboediens TaxID=65958 RepID=A0ABS5SQ18_9PROT|nr:ABC transporter ATP-binding protein [Komagataeibacter oboediens]MBL7232717.1 ABC transporter ATP-binding protein [Komagataeibacter oboediens]MBT0676304.1 ABC transporter ATP-binding protein [Komagataeibacter oboediens]MBT0679491.1 ABC transporter ATP-binding protein [Komagataeibacter oboediens]
MVSFLFRPVSGRHEFSDVLGFVWRRWRTYPGFLAWTLAGIASATVADVMMPLLAGWLVNDVSRPAQHAAVHRAIWDVVGLTVLGLGGIIARRTAYIGISHLTSHVMIGIVTEVFARVQRFSSEWHASNFAGSTVRRITRGMGAVDTLGDTLLLMLVPEGIVLCATTAVLAFHWPLMGLVLAVGAAALVALSVMLTLRYVAPSARLANTWDTRMGATLSDAVTCNAVVKACGAEAREDARLAWVAGRWRKRTVRSWLRGTDSANLQNLAALVMRMVLIAGVALLWVRGRAGPGDVAYVLTMMFVIQGYLRDIGQQISVVQRSVNEMEELVTLFHMQPAVADRPGAAPLRVTHGHIRFEHVRFGYERQHGRLLFDDLNLDIAPGSRVALVGPSGSGKTTLTRMLQRLYDVQGGRITIDGTDIATVTQASLRGQIAIVPQEPLLFHRSLAENIAYGRPDATDAEIEHAARQANAADFIARLPRGYATMVGERGVKLSGGERQRIAIARAFLSHAPIVIMDEATSSLDSRSEMLVQQAMERLMAGRTVLVIAHRLSTVMGLDRIIVFRHGQVCEDGPHATLMTREGGIYRGLFELQSL